MADTATVPELRTEVGASYLVTASVSHKRAGGWIGCRQVPTFVLPGDVLGIVDERHARDIATSLLREVAGDTVHSITVSVTRMA